MESVFENLPDIRKECLLVWRSNVTLPSHVTCYQVMYTRYPPYTKDWNHGYVATLSRVAQLLS